MKGRYSLQHKEKIGTPLPKQPKKGTRPCVGFLGSGFWFRSKKNVFWCLWCCFCSVVLNSGVNKKGPAYNTANMILVMRYVIHLHGATRPPAWGAVDPSAALHVYTSRSQRLPGCHPPNSSLCFSHGVLSAGRSRMQTLAVRRS